MDSFSWHWMWEAWGAGHCTHSLKLDLSLREQILNRCSDHISNSESGMPVNPINGQIVVKLVETMANSISPQILGYLGMARLKTWKDPLIRKL